MSREIVEAIKGLEQEKGIDADTLMEALEDALLSAYKKTPGAAKYARVDLNHDTADFRVFELILPPELEEKLMEEVISEQEQTIDPETGEMREPEEPELDPEIIAPYEDQITTRDVTPDDFGRIAAQTAKQVILQRIREAERHMMFEEYQDRVGELITGIIQQSDNRYTLVQLRERVEALLPRSEQVWNERYDHGMRVKAVITEVNAEGKGPGIVVSRRSPELIKELFELEVPEIADSLVEIVGVAREPGYRSKIAVISHADGVDPVGACVGPRGSRVRMVVSELRGEKIDIIPYNEEPARFVAKALSPARVREVLVDDETQEATVIVPDDQLSLAIGREGQNARLAAKLTGWKVDIKSETEFSQEEDELTYEEGEEVDGRCAAVLSAGRRCPNASLQGSRYCGLPQHQALARFHTNQVTVLSALSDEEVGMLADPKADEAQVRPLTERATAAFEQEGEAADEGEAAEERAGTEVQEAQEEREEAEQELEEAAEQADADVAEAEQELEEAEEEAAESAEADETPAADDGDDGESSDGEEETSGEPEEESVEEPEKALAEDAAAEGEEPSPETEAAAVGANPGDESGSSEDSEEKRS
jgi:transcription termination/antitermination protein NusA